MVDERSSRATTAASAAEALDRVAQALDDAVPESDYVGNKVFRDQSRTVRWAGTLFAVCAVCLVPWIIVIAVTLPARQLSPNYDIAWAGYDVLLCAALASTAGSALRRSRHLGMTASWSAALLVVDAWFDVMTSPSGFDRLEAAAMAVIIELPLALACVWLTIHAQDIADLRVKLLLRGRRTPPSGVGRVAPLPEE